MGKVIWTNHLYERIKQRGLDPRLVDTAVRFPDRIDRSTTTHSNKHIKITGGYEIVAAVKKSGSDWIITSAWWKPVYSTSSRHSRSNYQPKRFFLEQWIHHGLLALEKMIFGKK